MDREALLLHLEKTPASQVGDALMRAADWLLQRRFLVKDRVMAIGETVATATRLAQPELLTAAAMMLVPEGWNGNIGFGKGLKRAVLFSPNFVSYCEEEPIEAEHESPAIALAIAAILARP